MYQEKFWILFSKKLTNEATLAELKELENLIQEHPEWQYAIQNLEDLWKYRGKEQDLMMNEDAYMLHLNRMQELNIPFEEIVAETAPVVAIKSKRRWYWAAASVVILLSGAFVFRKLSGGAESEMKSLAREVNEISTRPASKSKVELPDGTVVWLNSGSKLTYDKNYNKERREVTLTGEGFFDVQKNKERPFIIHTSNINIKVLGTVFNVKAYPEDKVTETSLIRGSIEVTIKNRPNDKIILSPSEKLVVENAELEKIKEKTISPVKPEPASFLNTIVSINKLKYSPADSTLAEIEWINNRLVFREETFSDIAVKMERWYDVDIDITDAGLQQRRLSGTFQSETISQALEALKISIPFKYEQTGNKIIIHR